MINAHTHIFTINHVPNQFAKGLFWLGGLITVSLIRAFYKIILFFRKIRDFGNSFFLTKWIGKIVFKLLFFVLMWALRRLGLSSFNRFLSEETKGIIDRYLRLLEYGEIPSGQLGVFQKLQTYYPPKTKFVVLPMDLEYMGGGKPKENYYQQLQQVINVKNGSEGCLIPFLFVDPRRITDPNDTIFTYDYIEEKLKSGDFEGIKIYPALGYWPFDWRLLPVYLLAIKYDVPILTHCIEGLVHYRGNKKKEWYKHPFNNMSLKESHVKRYTTQFTHPLNYVIITNKKYLTHYLNNVKGNLSNNTDLNLLELWKELDLTNNVPELAKLKLNLGHWGGGTEWDRYMGDTNYPVINNLLGNLDTDFDKFQSAWYGLSWFGIINNLCMHPDYCFYTDISFTLHQEKYLNLLKVKMQNPIMRKKILFGTDYYVVSQKETEREFAIDVRGSLGEKDWKQISETNPKAYLSQ